MGVPEKRKKSERARRLGPVIGSTLRGLLFCFLDERASPNLPKSALYWHGLVQPNLSASQRDGRSTGARRARLCSCRISAIKTGPTKRAGRVSTVSPTHGALKLAGDTRLSIDRDAQPGRFLLRVSCDASRPSTVGRKLRDASPERRLSQPALAALTEAVRLLERAPRFSPRFREMELCESLAIALSSADQLSVLFKLQVPVTRWWSLAIQDW